jgi:APA family basic amino acid/polyamine antiporter
VVERGTSRVPRLRRALSVAGVYAIGYGNVGSSIYYALGIVAAYALGATPVALGLAGLIFIFTAMTYAEGVAMVPTAGGSVAFARRALNDAFSFVAGWALALNYAVTTAISTVSAAFYLSHFWPELKGQPALAASVGMLLILLLMLLNIRGVKETARLNIGFAVIDLATQALLVLLGIGIIMGGWRNLLDYRLMGDAYWPESRQLVFAVALAMVAYVGLESAAQMAEETKAPTRTVPRALLWSVVTVIFMFAALPIVALCAMSPMELVTEWGNDPVAGIASKLPDVGIATGVLSGKLSLSRLMLPWVAVLASTILLIAANAGILAGSRITYNMARHKQLFGVFGVVHGKFSTPHIAIIIVSGAAMIIVAAGMTAGNLLLRLGDLYVFSAMMAFAMAHLSVWMLRIKEPETPRPYTAWPSVRIKGRSISITATIGFLCCVAIWLVMALTREHRFGLIIGGPWIALGLAFYVWYRRREGLDLRRPAVDEQLSPLVSAPLAPRRQRLTQEITRILIPVHTPKDAEEQVRVACDLNTLYRAEIVATYVIQVPRTLPIDADLTDEMARAQSVLEAVTHIADSVYDTTVSTAVLQARNVGSAIVEYALQREVDLILMIARPDQAQKDARLTYGLTADYVVRNAPCLVWVLRQKRMSSVATVEQGPAQTPPSPPAS